MEKKSPRQMIAEECLVLDCSKFALQTFLWEYSQMFKILESGCSSYIL